jgi:1-acyl-sn-glycerol-3-phosphate acyltransferase
MIIARSFLFNVVFYLHLIAWMFISLPALVLPGRYVWYFTRGWAKSSAWLLRVIAGTKVEVRGLENVPKSGCILASKHQSMWETVSLFEYFDRPAVILKRELMFIPMFGWYALKTRMIPINRGKGSTALKGMLERATEELANGRPILIYPEGTRRPAGAPPAYKYGVAKLYTDLGVPAVPIALNSGLFWPRREFRRFPGTIVLEIMPPIPPGLSTEAFLTRLQDAIEPVSNRLLAEAARSPNPPPLSAEVRASAGLE